MWDFVRWFYCSECFVDLDEYVADGQDCPNCGVELITEKGE